MKEDDNNLSGKLGMPDDAVLVKQSWACDFFFSKSAHLLYVRASGCQAGPVRIERRELIDLLNIYDQQLKDKEAQLLADLECDEDDF